ncbi:beta-N-acetylhexosaminidase [uncultured Friedmanniella sp.]|uniref:beta-N-acetylhexosaminidase n=1 Tax=uncultured Friedmanniella sp. TaxID=335381 RepID=UPI0035CBC9F4
MLPQPRSVVPGTGSFRLTPELAVDAPPGWAAILRRLLGPGTGLDLPAAADGRLRLVADAALAPEAYTLTVSEDGIVITAADHAGVNWATQTLRQLLPPSVLRPAPSGDPLVLDAVEITDAPAYAWRGMHLDVARHFMPLAQVFRVVDLVALHKHNVLHLHLTDDQGWRFESLRYPRLQEVASWRTETRRPYDTEGDGTPHGGFYTQAQLRSLVRYAADRGVTVVPELEFPGHVSGVLAAYPELGNAPGRAHATATTFGVFPEVLNLNDAAMQVVLDLYEELLDIFPSRYVHVGGDECPRDEWLASPAAAQLARQRGLAGPVELQRWFTEQLRGWLTERGRVLVGWDEISDEGPVPGSVVMAWRDARYGREAVAAGLPVVMAPMSHLYFDWYSSTDEAEPYAIGGLSTVEHIYSYDPLEGIPAAGHPLVLGTQCQLWTEYVPDSRRAEYLLFPRACAHAEVAWSDPAGRSWAEFEPRLAEHLGRLDALGIDYRPLAGPQPWQQGGTGPLRRPDAHR